MRPHIIKLPPPRPEINHNLVDHLTQLLKKALNGELKEFACASTTDIETVSYIKENNKVFAAYAGCLLHERAMEE
jgi:hypothetical protein